MTNEELVFDQSKKCTECRYWRMCRFARNIFDAYETERGRGWITNWRLYESIWIGIANYCQEYILAEIIDKQIE